jgi:hypothetical protein
VPGLSALAIDWQQPWLGDWREIGVRVEGCMAQGMAVHEALNLQSLDAPRAPVRFVPQTALPTGVAYEQYIFEQRCVPTRDGAHDFFNGLCWLQFPQTKQKLNSLQAAQIAAAGVGAVRGPVRDAITVFDENAAFFMGPDVLWQALQTRDWRELFITQRALWDQARLVLFGHALLEKLLTPRKSITTHVYRVESGLDSLAALDAWVAQDLSEDKLARKPFVPLPVLGVPHWWPENEKPDFYEDPQVFRPLRNSP